MADPETVTEAPGDGAIGDATLTRSPQGAVEPLDSPSAPHLNWRALGREANGLRRPRRVSRLLTHVL